MIPLTLTLKLSTPNHPKTKSKFHPPASILFTPTKTIAFVWHPVARSTLRKTSSTHQLISVSRRSLGGCDSKLQRQFPGLAFPIDQPSKSPAFYGHVAPCDPRQQCQADFKPQAMRRQMTGLVNDSFLMLYIMYTMCRKHKKHTL